MEDDRKFMRIALGLGARGLGRVWPNPAVGCVIVQAGRIVGRGWTQPGGRPHAETMALAQAGDAARGATVYVTLEPCVHHGHTPPCAEGLVAAGVARVVVALYDPDPRVSRKGLALLWNAGIDVKEGVCAGEAHLHHVGFFSRVLAGRPWVTLKMASTLDGRIATSTGESRWITGPVARRAVHALRLRHDAVMVGAATARTDDPDLSVRGIGGTHQPLRVVFDSRLSLDPASRLGRTALHSPVWMCHTAAATPKAVEAWARTGAQLILCDADEKGRVNTHDALHRLAVAGVTRLLCEGGAGLAGSLMEEGLVDDLILFTAGKVIGGDGLNSIAPMGVVQLKNARQFDLVESRKLGEDVMHHWRRPGFAG